MRRSLQASRGNGAVHFGGPPLNYVLQSLAFNRFITIADFGFETVPFLYRLWYES